MRILNCLTFYLRHSKSPEGLEKFGILLEVIEHPVDGLICATQGLSVIFTVGIRTDDIYCWYKN